MVSHLTRALQDPLLIIIGDLHSPLRLEPGFELWRVPFRGWDEPHDLRARARCRPRRFVVVDGDGVVRDSGPTATPECGPGEIFTLCIASPQAA